MWKFPLVFAGFPYRNKNHRRHIFPALAQGLDYLSTGNASFLKHEVHDDGAGMQRLCQAAILLKFSQTLKMTDLIANVFKNGA